MQTITFDKLVQLLVCHPSTVKKAIKQLGLREGKITLYEAFNRSETEAIIEVVIHNFLKRWGLTKEAHKEEVL